MKNITNLACVIALLITMPGCKSPTRPATLGQVTFNGSTSTMYNGKTIVIRNASLGQADTTRVSNGRFRFIMPFKESCVYDLFVTDASSGSDPRLSILVSRPDTITIKADVADLSASVITGADENDLYRSFVSSESEARQRIDQKLAEKYGKDYAKHFEPHDLLYNDVMAYYEKLASAAAGETFDLARKHAHSFAAMYMLQTKVNELSADTLERLYNILGNEFKHTGSAIIVANKIKAEKLTAIGKPAPAIEQADTAGKMIRLSDFKGRFVLIDFWASWCGPCREENPNLLRAYKRFHNRGFTVLGVSLDDKKDKDKWLAAIRKDKLEWAQVSDLRSVKNAAAITYGVTSIPQNFLVGPDGTIVAKGLMGDDLINKLNEKLAIK